MQMRNKKTQVECNEIHTTNAEIFDLILFSSIGPAAKINSTKISNGYFLADCSCPYIRLYKHGTLEQMTVSQTPLWSSNSIPAIDVSRESARVKSINNHYFEGIFLSVVNFVVRPHDEN